MLNKIFTRQPRLDHADPAQRILGLAEPGVDAAEVERLLLSDPVVAVRIRAAGLCSATAALIQSATSDPELEARDASLTQLAALIATMPDEKAAQALLEDERLPDSLRTDAAQRGDSPERRELAIRAVRDESALVGLALDATRAETRMAAAERVVSVAALQQLVDGARNKDHGIARLAKQRLDAKKSRASQEAEADAVLSALESLAAEPGPILTAVVELNRRWQALNIAGDPARLARCETARQAIQARFDREQEQQRAKAQYERKLRDWLAEQSRAGAPETPEALTALREMLAALREEAGTRGDQAGLAQLDGAQAKINGWEALRAAQAGAEALVVEAERLAADTSIDDAQLPLRWQSLDRSTRTPDLTRRFEAALMTIEQRRLAQVQATMQQASAAKLQLHTLLHDAEQAVTAGRLQAARVALEEIRTLKAAAGTLPKPTTQRLSRAVQQLADLERWESFGQQSARTQLCERAEALAAQPSDPAHLAQEVQKLRNEWKALDEQYKGVPKALWERFDHACEKAYAPAARHFAEVAAQRKDARRRRDEFIAAAAAHGPTLITDIPDWRAVEHWLRDTEHGWRDTALGSVDPGTWKKLETRLKDALAPARDALAAARAKAKAEREALIAEANALLPRAAERDAPTQIKAIQQRWQQHAKQLSLAQRDERALWEQFRSACDAVFTARHAKRNEEENRKSEHKRALEAVCVEMETAAQRKDVPEHDIKRAVREAQDKWKALSAASDPALREVEPRFRKAKSAIDDLLANQTRNREAAVWQTLSAKERLCEELDRAALETGARPEPPLDVADRWSQLPELQPGWEKPLKARRDAAVRALTDNAAANTLREAIAKSAPGRRETLLELELVLGLETPRELQAERLALQVRQLKERFKSTVSLTPENAGERFVMWCGIAGVADEADRRRAGRIADALGSIRGRMQTPREPHAERKTFNERKPFAGSRPAGPRR